METSNQIWQVLKLNFKLKYKAFLGLGFFMYLGIILFALLNPNFFGIFGDLVFDESFSIIEIIIITGIVMAFLINIGLVVFSISSGFVGKKRDFYLLPYDFWAKIHALVIYIMSWILLNIVSVSLLLIIVSFWKKTNVKTILEYFRIAIENFGSQIFMGIIEFFVFILFYSLMIALYTLIKFERGSFKNSIIFIIQIISYSFISNISSSIFGIFTYNLNYEILFTIILIIVNYFAIYIISKKMNIKE